ncbi:MAG: hypothetical protein HY049_04280 [Acidobacteria bacterium]|nr:hypothetical protein [Acidobacteriota bacterium]
MAARAVRWDCAAAALVLTALAVSLGAADQPQTQVLEPGYAVRVFPRCGQAGVARSLAKKLTTRPVARALACAPAPAWGDALFLSMVNEAEPSADIERFDPVANENTVFVPPGAESFASSLAVSPSPSPFGDIVIGSRMPFVTPPPLRIYYVASSDPSGAPGFGLVLTYPVFSIAFDPTGAFGSKLYLSTPKEVQQVDPSGSVAGFALISGGMLRFGPGGAWGSDLYSSGAGGVRIDASGFAAVVPGGFGDFDWGSGAGFGDDMFARCSAGSSDLCRIHPDGTRAVWATGVAGPFTFCGQALWIYSASGCERITFGANRPD